MSDLTVPKSDYGYNLDFTVKDADENAYNLTGYTITMKAWYKGNPDDLIATGDCDIDVAVSGTCHYTVQDGDFDTEGDYLIELEFTKSEVVESTRYYTLRVEESA